jgi:hypothetical protein
MAIKKPIGGLGTDLNSLVAQQKAVQAKRNTKQPWNPSDDTLIPTTAEEIAAREAYYAANPTEYDTIEDGLSRNDGLGSSYDEERSRITRGSYTDPDFGPGWDVLDPAPSRNLGRNRAQKAAYSSRLMVLVIVMRDGAWIRYDGVYPSEWMTLKNSTSTNDFVQWNLHAHPWRDITSEGVPPTPQQAFTKGKEEQSPTYFV